MRRFGFILLQVTSSLSLSFALCTAPAWAAPFTNGGFETGSMSPWIQNNYFADGINWNVTDSVAHTGTFSLTSTGSKEIRQTFDGIISRTLAQVSFYARHDNAAGGDLTVTLAYADQSENEFTISAGSSTDWVFFDITHLLVARKSLTGFGVSGISSGCPASCTQVWIDDVVIARTPEPNVFLLLGLGLAGLSGRRRLAR